MFIPSLQWLFAGILYWIALDSIGVPYKLETLNVLTVVLTDNIWLPPSLITFYCDLISKVQEQPSPEPPVELLPRLCHLLKGQHGYGFNLHSNKSKRGQFVRLVDPGSAAESADIRPGDRLVEVYDQSPEAEGSIICKHYASPLSDGEL